MLSTHGGMDIEQVADEHPEAIATLHVDPLVGFQPFHGRRLAFEAAVDADVVRPIGAMLATLYAAFVGEDATLVEINPLIITPDRRVVALDAKVTLDDNARFRHPDHAALDDDGGADPQELMARERGLTYVKLDGDIGIFGNGAGLVMSTLDVVAHAGGAPANFLDAGGGAKAEAIAASVDVILTNPNVKAVLFNVFGGITRCDEVARGIIDAYGILSPTRAVRRAPGRDERRRGAQAAGRREPAQRLRRVDDGRRRGARRRARARHRRGRMSIIVGDDTRLVVSGLTGREGTYHALNNRRYGTNVVAGVTPGKGGQDVEGIPVFNTFREAVAATGANTAMIFVPARFAADSILEAEDAGIATIIAITEGIPAHDELRVFNVLKHNPDVRLVGPELPGRAVAGQGERRDHPGAVLQARQRRRRLALGHADLPDRQRAGPQRLRQLDDRRHRRRPGPGLVVRRHHRPVRGRPRDRADRHERRDRRLGGGGGGGLHRRARRASRSSATSPA